MGPIQLPTLARRTLLLAKRCHHPSVGFGRVHVIRQPSFVFAIIVPLVLECIASHACLHNSILSYILTVCLLLNLYAARLLHCTCFHCRMP